MNQETIEAYHLMYKSCTRRNTTEFDIIDMIEIGLEFSEAHDALTLLDDAGLHRDGEMVQSLRLNRMIEESHHVVNRMERSLSEILLT